MAAANSTSRSSCFPVCVVNLPTTWLPRRLPRFESKMSRHGLRKMSAKPCYRYAEESLAVVSLRSRKQKPPNSLLIQGKTFYNLGPCYPEIQPDDLLHHPRISLRQIAQMNPSDERLAFFSTQRHVFRWLVQNRFLAIESAHADGGAGQPWPTDAGAWLFALAKAAERQAASARRVLPGVDRSPPW